MYYILLGLPGIPPVKEMPLPAAREGMSPITKQLMGKNTLAVFHFTLGWISLSWISKFISYSVERMNMISVHSLSKYYDGFCAVDNIDLQVNQGEIVGLLGPNGAGKTTTLRILTGYLRPSSGTVRIKDMSLDQNLTSIKKSIGYLPESAPLYRNMLVYDYLRYAGRVRNMSDQNLNQRLQDLVGQCGLRQIMHKPIGELSRGLKQRVGLAHALLHDPEILILDEPTSGLDPNQILEIRSLIKNLGHDKTIILSTHILSEAEATCDRMVIIHQGRIAADGSPDSLKQGAAGGEIKLTLAGSGLEQAAALLSQIPGVQNVHPASEPMPDSLELTMSTDPKTDPRADIYRAVKTTDWDILELTGQTRSLETIFKELTLEQ